MSPCPFALAAFDGNAVVKQCITDKSRGRKPKQR